MLKLGSVKLRMLHQIARLAYRIPRLSFEARLIEYDFARANIDRSHSPKRILDLGCCGSKLPIELAKLGHEVYGIDVGDYPDPKLFTFIQGDIRQMPFNAEFFDVVTAVSTIEHIGLGRYGDPIAPDGDKEAMGETRRVLKRGGQLLMTLPCGKDTICHSKDGVPLHRAYSPTSLNNLLSRLKILEISYIVKKRGMWVPATVSEVENVSKNTKAENVGLVSVALIVAQKEK
jgi:ubiquinone/menaquinone biosynthesis C-methylase UbiE